MSSPSEVPIGRGRAVLIVDDEPVVQETISMVLEEVEFRVVVSSSVAEARAALDSDTFDVLILDKNLPDGSGLEVAQLVRERELDAEMVMLTGYGTMDSAIDAIKLGIADYLQKPLPDIYALWVVLRRVLDLQNLRRERRGLLDELQQKTADLESKNAELEALAVRDPLTKLFNHAFLQRELSRTLHLARRHDYTLSLITLDFDSFKEVNNDLGHRAGDDLLVEFAQLLGGQTRAGDVPFRLEENDVAARYGGDEFVLMLPATPKRGALAQAERLRACVEAHEFGISGLSHQTVSIGVASFPQDAADQVSLLEAASRALNGAKRAGRNRIMAFRSDLPASYSRSGGNTIDAERSDALTQLISSVDLDIAYQPIVRAGDGSVFAYEALCRPRPSAFPHPGVLIETAEHSGRIRELGRVLRRAAVAGIAKLPDDALLFVNLHPHELYDPELQAVEPFMEPCAGRIVLEVTETADITDYTRVKKTLSVLRNSGFRCALDDLGSGYAGLNTLALIEPDFVKLDMQLVRGVVSDHRTRRLVQHIIEFSVGEGALVIAEGVETEVEREILLKMQCPLLQGYLFGRPTVL